MRMILILAGFALAACAGPQATVAPVAPQGYAAMQPEAAVLPPEPATFQSVLDLHGVPLRTPAVGKAIVVNIPSFEAVLLEDGVEVMRSRVIVGSPSRRTPNMETTTTVVRFRPHWRPTPSMIASGAYEDRLVPPGPRNPLGAAAIRLADGDLIYLHGTNRPELFSRDARALSWGCVRVERLDEVLAWLLDETPEQVAEWTKGRRTFDQPTDGAAVIITYQTAFPDPGGALVRHADVYRRGETQLLAAR